MRISRLLAPPLASILCLFTAACTEKDLTEATARAQLSETFSRRPYSIAVGPLLTVMANSEVDFTASAASGGHVDTLKRLLNRGFVKQEVHVERYPAIGGSWHGENTCLFGTFGSPEQILAHVLANQNARCWKYRMAVQLESMSNSNRVSGTWKWDHLRGTLEAFVTTDNELTFTKLNGPNQADGRFFYLERGDRAYLVSPAADWLYVGSATRRRSEVKRYSYIFAPTVQAVGESVSFGKVEVLGVSQLLLTTETRATASFRWRIALDDFGNALMNDVPPSGLGTAEFAKKPDGTWVVMAASIPPGSL